jgi:hypothetical protein
MKCESKSSLKTKQVRKIPKKEIDFFEVAIKFLVRKGSYSAKNKQQLKQNIISGLGCNDMNCIEVEDVKVRIKD